MNENTELTTRNEGTGELVHRLPVAAPAVDIYENEHEILLHADMPGVLKDDIAINIDNGKMTLSGFRRVQQIGASTWREFTDIEYRRTFSVPQSIDIGKVHAELKDGVLRLHLPKSEAAKPRQIEITTV
ncbi:Hsp20/alpha crystallin family protein [Desulfobulbus alkaliphilus]|uniref:Hsp20/alpha crystallin family protein n=1 Tax=Desulfobulbus alkaliphilus TaxID=869814 RepID=UPI00196614D6|nr:Hsp20/alpha crystallin family protein [Desulfobulbus alkaliphilus]MBM9538401.1 Hsp20/alpha crystallin family protein [Desulfobulbus alkaliphilus]